MGISIIGKIILLAGFLDWKRGFKKDEYSHVATIVMQPNGKLGIIEALIKGVVINDLETRIKNSKDSIILCVLNDKSFALYKQFKDRFNKGK